MGCFISAGYRQGIFLVEDHCPSKCCVLTRCNWFGEEINRLIRFFPYRREQKANTHSCDPMPSSGCDKSILEFYLSGSSSPSLSQKQRSSFLQFDTIPTAQCGVQQNPLGSMRFNKIPFVESTPFGLLHRKMHNDVRCIKHSSTIVQKGQTIKVNTHHANLLMLEICFVGPIQLLRSILGPAFAMDHLPWLASIIILVGTVVDARTTGGSIGTLVFQPIFWNTPRVAPQANFHTISPPLVASLAASSAVRLNGSRRTGWCTIALECELTGRENLSKDLFAALAEVNGTIRHFFGAGWNLHIKNHSQAHGRGGFGSVRTSFELNRRSIDIHTNLCKVKAKIISIHNDTFSSSLYMKKKKKHTS